MTTIDDIIWLRRKKCIIYRLDIIFSIIHVVQLMVSKINLFCQRDIRSINIFLTYRYNAKYLQFDWLKQCAYF